MEAVGTKHKWVGILCFSSCPHTQEKQTQLHLRDQGLRTVPGAPPLDDLLHHLSSDPLFSLNGSWTSVRQWFLDLSSLRGRGVWMSGQPRQLSTAGRGVLCPSGCPILPFTGSFLAGCKIHTISPRDSLLCCNSSKQIRIYNGFFLKTCIMCLIDGNDSLGETWPRTWQFFVVYNIHLFYMEEGNSYTHIGPAIHKTKKLGI